MQQWIDAAKIEQQKYANKVTFSHQRQGKWLLPTGWNKKSSKPQRHPNDQTVPMDVDTNVFAVRKVTTEEEKRQHKEQGKCFECHKTGHMARNCPTKKKQKGNQPFKSRTPFGKSSSWRSNSSSWRQRPNQRPYRKFENVRSAHIEEIDENPHDNVSPPDIDVVDLAVKAASFSDEQKEV